MIQIISKLAGHPVFVILSPVVVGLVAWNILPQIEMSTWKVLLILFLLSEFLSDLSKSLGAMEQLFSVSPDDNSKEGQSDG